MVKDVYSAVWVSYSSIKDFLSCPRLYYLRNVYKDPHTNHKITIINPPLALGQAVHEVIDSLSKLPVKKRLNISLIKRLDDAWEKIRGIQGGFQNQEIENTYRRRAEEMLRTIMDNPGPVQNLSIKIHQDLPYYYLSEKENIILCGKIDWLEYLPDLDSVHIIDFKTGRGKEEDDSLQLPIYFLIASHTQSKPVVKASYWYLETDKYPIKKILPTMEDARKEVLDIAKKIKLARKLNRFVCKLKTGCHHCRPYELILQGKAKMVGVNDFRQDVYVIDPQLQEDRLKSSIL